MISGQANVSRARLVAPLFLPVLSPGLDVPNRCIQMYFKKNQRDLTEQRMTYWAKKLIESYEEKESIEENEKNLETELKKN